jgi:hypothetical protein
MHGMTRRKSVVDAKGCRIASESVADFRRTTHLDTGIPLMGCVSTLPQSADSAARTNVSEHTRAGRPPPDDAAGETTNREEKDDEAHVHTDRANARPIRSGAHSREPSHGYAAQRGVWRAHIFREQRLLIILEPTGSGLTGVQSAKVVTLGEWSDDAPSALELHEPETTDLVVTLGFRH